MPNLSFIVNSIHFNTSMSIDKMEAMEATIIFTIYNVRMKHSDTIDHWI